MDSHLQNRCVAWRFHLAGIFGLLIYCQMMALLWLHSMRTSLQVGRIVHILPSDDLRRIQGIRLATAYVSNLVCQKLTRNTFDDVCRFLVSTRGDRRCQAMRGQLFKSFVMYRQSQDQGRRFEVKQPNSLIGKLQS